MIRCCPSLQTSTWLPSSTTSWAQAYQLSQEVVALRYGNQPDGKPLPLNCRPLGTASSRLAFRRHRLSALWSLIVGGNNSFTDAAEVTASHSFSAARASSVRLRSVMSSARTIPPTIRLSSIIGEEFNRSSLCFHPGEALTLRNSPVAPRSDVLFFPGNKFLIFIYCQGMNIAAEDFHGIKPEYFQGFLLAMVIRALVS